MPYMTRLEEGLRRFGLGPHLEFVPGWETRGSASFAPACTIGHHTAGPFAGDRPSLNVCVNGHGTLPGPLCNDFLSRSKVVLVAAGRANHAGVGGFRGLVGNSAAFGNEAESAGRRRPDGAPDWSEFQRWAFPRVHAAHLWVIGRDASWYAGHRDWTDRKIDPTDIETTAMRREIAALLANPDPEDDMPSVEEIWNFPINGVNARDRLLGIDLKTENIPGQVWAFPTSGQGVQAQDRLTGIDSLVQTVRQQVVQLVAVGDVDEAAVAAALAPAILAGLRQEGIDDKGLTEAQVEAAVRRVFADAAGQQ